MKKRIISIIMALALSLAMFTSCGGSTGSSDGGRVDPYESSKVDLDKAQLRITCWNGDFGLEWLNKIARRFEEFYSEHSFDGGKTKGVQVTVNPGGHVYGTSNLLNNVEEISIGEQSNYYEAVNGQVALDITDAVTTPLTEFGETKSIEDKFLSEDDITYYGSLGSKQTKTYYGLPWYESFMGFQYDIAYFEDNNLYFAADGMGLNGFVTNKNMPKSKGPDGVAGNSDDGLPATYDDFFKLLDKITDLGDEAVAWAGNAQVYINNLLSSLAADYNGYEQMTMHYTLDGEYTNAISVLNADGSYETSTQTLNESNGYLTRQSAGLYEGLKFIERLITTKDNGEYKYFNATHCTTTSYNHRFAQRKFLEGGFVDGAPRVGLLIDGSWWYAGAASIFKEMSSLPGAGAMDRRIGFMPFPKADASKIGEATFINNWSTSIHVRANVESSKVEMAKQFIRFMHTDESLSEFTMVTSGTRPFRYQLLDKHVSNTSYYGKQMMELHNTAKIVNPWSTTPLVLDNLNAFMMNDTIYGTTVAGVGYKNITTAMLKGVSAKAYFEGLDTNSKSEWDGLYSKYY